MIRKRDALQEVPFTVANMRSEIASSKPFSLAAVGFEPATFEIPTRCSTVELRPSGPRVADETAAHATADA